VAPKKTRKSTPRKRVGHPTLTGRPGQTVKHSIRVPDEQWGRWSAAAAKTPLTLSAWIRRELDRAAARQLARKGKNPVQLELGF
jgi:hypothetical protein